jgi:hypothetical protein
MGCLIKRKIQPHFFGLFDGQLKLERGALSSYPLESFQKQNQMHIEIKLEGSTSNFMFCLCPTFMNDAEFEHQVHTMRLECKDESLVDGEMD